MNNKEIGLQWTENESKLAIKEGWDLYYSAGSLDGDRQVQRNDEQGLLSEDLDAWRIIKEQKLPHHKKALAILKEENIKEYNRILTCNIEQTTINMDNLTKQQKELIKDLKKEFTKRNVPSNSGGMINTSEIKAEFREEGDRTKDVRLSNEKHKEHMEQVALKDVDLLNKDLKELGLSASFPNTHYIEISDVARRVCYSKAICIYFNSKYKYETLLSKQIGIATGFKYSYNQVEYDTLEEVVNRSDFIKALKKLFCEAQLKNKN